MKKINTGHAASNSRRSHLPTERNLLNTLSNVIPLCCPMSATRS